MTPRLTPIASIPAMSASLIVRARPLERPMRRQSVSLRGDARAQASVPGGDGAITSPRRAAVLADVRFFVTAWAAGFVVFYNFLF